MYRKVYLISKIYNIDSKETTELYNDNLMLLNFVAAQPERQDCFIHYIIPDELFCLCGFQGRVSLIPIN